MDISKAFSTSSQSVSEFFQQPGLGFYIPLYQREYSWDKDNIEQLMENICFGVENLLYNPNEEIRFMGTVILVRESDPTNNISPKDPRAFPTLIKNVIDGQQRISTISLLGSLLYQKLYQLRDKFKSFDQSDELRTEITSKLSTIEELFSIDLRRGKPSKKPVIIRGSVDCWTLDGDDEGNYNSHTSSYIASVIRAIHENTDFPKLPQGHLVAKNLQIMSRELNRIEKAHEQANQSEEFMLFPSAQQILEKIPESDLWTYERPELKQIIQTQNQNNSQYSLLCSLVQLLAFTHYLLSKCCFTVIDPISESWAFDMFQSLNATGTPLTAIETFKPMVVNFFGGAFKGSQAEKHFADIDRLFSENGGTTQKSKRTDEYLTAFAITYNGKNLARQFSTQRQWLTETYKRLSLEEKKEFVQIMGHTACYFYETLNFKYAEQDTLSNLNLLSPTERDVATLCVMYLRDSGHKMANTLLSRFYANILNNTLNASKEFLEVSKALAAFYTLWRSAKSNSGLDAVYRQILKISEGAVSFSWRGNQDKTTSSALKQYLRNVLQQQNIGNKEDWLTKATLYYRYDHALPVCKFGLLVVSQNTIPNEQYPGLLKNSMPNASQLYLCTRALYSKELHTLEHIAPRQPDKSSTWDSLLYETEDYHSIGNLVLLPKDINTSASNRSWQTKWLYYSHLTEKDPTKIPYLYDQAKNYGISLSEETRELLMKTPYTDHITSIVNVGIHGSWNQQLVKDRAKCICEILWDRMFEWLG